RRLAKRVGRSNLMIKIPGTRAGIAAVEQLLYEGIHVNVTLLFSVERYGEFSRAYWRALERRLREGKSAHDVRSVARFFLSRIDVLIDERLEQRDPGLRGKAAIASAKLAYQQFQRDLHDARWVTLARAGAKPQRLLWASTGVKNPRYRDVMYI